PAAPPATTSWSRPRARTPPASSPAKARCAAPASRPPCACCASAMPPPARPATWSWRGRSSPPNDPPPGAGGPAAGQRHGRRGAADAAATQELVAAAQARLPPSWAQALDRPVALEWRDDLPEGVHGRARQWRILLRRELLDDWKQRQGTAAPEAEAPALAALLHELAHLYDRTASGGMSRDPRLLDLAGWQKSAVRPGRRARNDFRDRSPDPYELAS